METTKIKIRPFIPSAKDEQKEGREPFALLTYGNVTIELDYTLLNYLRLDTQSGCWTKTQSICNRGIEEILNEMYLAMDGILPKYHRDTDNFKNLPYSHNPLSNLIADGHVEYESEPRTVSHNDTDEFYEEIESAKPEAESNAVLADVLLPCPFCGKIPDIKYDEYAGMYYIHCCRIIKLEEGHKEDIYYEWNTRVNVD